MDTTIDTENVLMVSSLKKKYRNNRGVESVSFTINRGDIFGLLGANGAGKTTTMKVIMGLIREYSGEVTVFGRDIAEHFEESMSEMGGLIEMPSFYNYLSAEKNMILASKYYSKKIDIEDIEQKLRLVNLYEYRKDKVSKFSLGMKQRMGLALAMISNPKLYILDEPANGLDIEGIIEIRNIIKELSQKTGASFLISSHQSGEIQKLCNKVGVIYNGILTNSANMDFILENYPSLEDYYLDCIGVNKIDEMRGGEL